MRSKSHFQGRHTWFSNPFWGSVGYLKCQTSENSRYSYYIITFIRRQCVQNHVFQWATCTLWPLVWCLQGDMWFSNPFWGSVGYLHFVATCLVSTRGYVVFKPVLGLSGLPALCGHLFGVYKGIRGFQTRFGAQWATCTLWPLVWCLQGDTWFSNPFWGSGQ